MACPFVAYEITSAGKDVPEVHTDFFDLGSIVNKIHPERRHAVRGSSILHTGKVPHAGDRPIYNLPNGTLRLLVRPSDESASEDITSLLNSFEGVQVRNREVPFVAYGFIARSADSRQLRAFQERVSSYVQFMDQELRRTGSLEKDQDLQYSFTEPIIGHQSLTSAEYLSTGSLIGETRAVMGISPQLPILGRDYNPAVYITSSGLYY